MFELTNRLSFAMKDFEVENYFVKDFVVNAFRSFEQLNHMIVSSEIQIVFEVDYATTLNGNVKSHDSNLVLLP